jgi:FkbM family methyltransferase
MKDIYEFHWGTLHNTYIGKNINKEVFENRIYEKLFKVENGDVVVDIGASVGPFTYSILDKCPSQVFCIEPSKDLFPILEKNVKSDSVICINKAISSKNELNVFNDIYSIQYVYAGKDICETECITFKTFINEYNIEKIDFLKFDCEGAEYDIFNDENFDWITKNVKKISGEFHLITKEQQQKMNKFKNTYLKYFTNFRVFSTNTESLDITDCLLNFESLGGMIMIYIDNTNNN